MLPLFIAVVLLGDSVVANPESQIEQSRQFESVPRPLMETAPRDEDPLIPYADAPDSSGDEDLGVQRLLRRRDAYEPFSIFGDVGAYYTSNVGLAKRGEVSDAFLVGQFGASYRPRFTPTLYGEVTARQQFFRYDEFDGLNYNSTNAGVGLTWIIPEAANLIVGLRYNYNILFDEDFEQDFFSNHTITPTIQKNFVYSRNVYSFVGLSTLFGFADPHLSQRNEYSIYGGIFAKLTRHIEGQLTHRVTWNDFSTGGRDDLNNTTSVNIAYRFNEWGAVGASASHTFNNSNQPVFDYTVFNTGGGLFLNVKF